MFNVSKNSNSKTPVPIALALSLIGIFALSLPIHAQSGSTPAISSGNSIYGGAGTTALRDPLVNGANFSLPGVPSAQGAIPPLGSGLVPLPPNPGMLLAPPTLIPWANGIAGNQFSLPTNQVVVPANQINVPSNVISLPVSNAIAMPPGVMNAVVGGSIPPEPSTPGANPGMLRPPSFYNGSSGASAGQSQNSAAAIGAVNSNGQITGSAPTTRPTRQGSNDFGLPRTANAYRLQGTAWVPQAGSTTTDFGNFKQAAVKKAQISFDSPMPAQYPGQGQAGVPQQTASGNHTRNFANAQVTNDLYGIPMINPNKMTTSSSGAVSQGPPPSPLTTLATQ